MKGLLHAHFGFRGLVAAAVFVLAAAGCAEIPLNNGPPDVPELDSTGVRGAFGLPVNVTARDPDGDRMAIEFIAESGTSRQVFAWSSYVGNGTTTEFFLNLSAGSWTIYARARDELEDMSDYAKLDLTVTQF